MAIENPDLVPAYHQISGVKSEVPEHWLGKDSPFPGQWGKTAPSAAQTREAVKAVADAQKEG